MTRRRKERRRRRRNRYDEGTNALKRENHQLDDLLFAPTTPLEFKEIVRIIIITRQLSAEERKRRFHMGVLI